MGVYHLPFWLNPTEEKCFVAFLVNFLLIPFDGGLHSNFGDGPSKTTLKMYHCVFKIQAQGVEVVLLWNNVVFYKILQPNILPTRLNVARTIKVEKMLLERLWISVFPARLNIGYNRFNGGRI